MISCYTPDFVKVLSENAWTCSCAGCNGVFPKRVVKWDSQVRESASILCNTVASAVLNSPTSFQLHTSEVQAGDNVLSEKTQLVNQGCINLLVGSAAEISVTLFAIGAFLSKAKTLTSLDEIAALQNEFVTLLDNGTLAMSAKELPVIDSFKLDMMNGLSALVLGSGLELDISAMLKLNEVEVFSSEYKLNWLQEISDCESEVEYSQWLNYFLYPMFDSVFPGTDESMWEQNFLELCQRHFMLKLALGLFSDTEIGIDKETFTALAMATWSYDLPTVSHAEKSLIAFSLLN